MPRKGLRRYEGGCAIMLKVPAPPCARLQHEAIACTAGVLMWAPIMTSYHLTLQFVGRNLDSNKVCSVIVAAFGLVDPCDWIPAKIRFTGLFQELRTFKNKSLVAEVENNDALEKMRKQILDGFRVMAVKPKDDFGTHPHVTLAKAPLGAGSIRIPEPIAPFEVECSEVLVKYGSYQMTI